jgi:hypothetical protein
MRHDPQFLLWLVTAPSVDAASRVQQELAHMIAPDAVFVDDIRAGPVDAQALRNESHRYGDYFVSIRVLPPAQPEPTFRLLFHRRTDAGRFWKDLMARILQRIRRTVPANDSDFGLSG